MKQLIILSGLLLLQFYSKEQPFARWTKNRLDLDNGFVQREIGFDGSGLATRSLKLKESDLNFDLGESGGFSFLLDGKSFDGRSGWQVVSVERAGDDHRGDGALLHLEGSGQLKGIAIEIIYLLYPDLPVIRKQIRIINNTARAVRLEAVDIEKIRLGFNFAESVVYSNYGRQKHLGTYIGNWDDPLLAIHSYERNAGILLGDESPGVLKRIDYNTRRDNADLGLTHPGDAYPFRKYIKAGDRWTSPRVFVIPYIKAADPGHAMNHELAAFERKHMGLRIFDNPYRPSFLYNNYNPFGSDINDSLILGLARAAAASGIRQFELDCGWHRTAGNKGKKLEWISNTGDWLVDESKFPNGLKPVMDTIRRLGMETGLWVSVGSAASSSAVFKTHPEWAVRDERGRPTNLHYPDESDLNTMCFGTGWKNYIFKKISGLVQDLDLSLLKLDLTVATSAYISASNHSGCYAKNHPDHKDHEESFWVIYENLFSLFDQLHQQKPDLYIDCTFETEGRLQMIDYAFLEHAEGNWLTNIGEPYPVGAYRVRDLTWWKSPAVPASALIIGNLRMDDPDFIAELKTLSGSFPVVLGDPRKLSDEQRHEIKQWASWLELMRKKYDFDIFRQDLPGFGEPAEGNWDGWSRINTDNQTGGIIGVFREGSPDNTRLITVPGLKPDGQYKIKQAPGQAAFMQLSGRELGEKGFPVTMDSAHEARLFEVELLP